MTDVNFRKMFCSEVIDLIKNTQGTNAKVEVLRKAVAETPFFVEFLKATLDPMIRYNIRKIPEYKKLSGPGITTLGSVLKNKKLDPLILKKKTGHEASKYLESLLSDLCVEDAKGLEIIISRDLDCGVSYGSIQKVLPDLIQEYPVMLCTAYSPDRLKKFNFKPRAISQIKLDGLRGNIIVRGGQVDTRSRNGKELGLDDLFQFVAAKYPGGEFVLDGEVLVRDPKNPKAFLPRKTGNGIINKCAKGTASDSEKALVTFVVFDYIPLINFLEGSLCKIPYEERFSTVRNIVLNLQNPMLEIVESRYVDNADEAKEHFAEATERLLEGTILKTLEAPWYPGRPDYQLKFKLEQECDLIIESYYEGEGRNKGRLGGFTCASSDGKLKVNVGGGYSDEEREKFWQERDSMIGKIMEVLYNEKISSGGNWSLFLPRKHPSGGIRNDKNVANSLEEIP